jgi:hypothetical protein
MIQRVYRFTVILMHPERWTTYQSRVYARDPNHAEDLARQEYGRLSSIEDLDSIGIIAIYWGYHDDVQRTCRPAKEIKNEHP